MDKNECNIMDMIKISFRCSRGYSSLIALNRIIEGLIPNIQILITANFLNTAISVVNNKQEFKDIILPIILLMIFIGYTWISGQLIKFVEIKLEFVLRERFRVDITEKRGKLKYKYIENQDTWDLISRVSNKPEVVLKNGYINTLSFFSMILRIGGLLVILLSQIWWAGIVILLMTIPLIFLAIRGGRSSYDANRQASKYIRRYEYFEEVLKGRDAVLERTLFGFTDGVNEQWKKHYEIARKTQFKVNLKHFIRLKGSSVITAIISILMAAVLIKPVVDKELSVGMFISITSGIFSLIQVMSWQLSYYVKELSKNSEYLKDLRDFYDLEETKEGISLPLKKGIRLDSLEFRNVSFKYPGTDNYILKDLSFEIKKGVNYAFVGSNGSGKTTVTKLITGLYDDFEGEILINDKSIKDYSQRQLKSLFSVVYQDFGKYYISFKDNIAIGDINTMGQEIQEEKIRNAIELMDLEDVINRLPKKIDTPLGKVNSDGQDLSEGQWQRIAMARSIISSASLTILDEPTASLDPVSESNVYEEFKEISKSGTTIFISHRLGSTQLAKEIFVLENGAIIEKGSHKELMEINGVYSNMYESQRSWYL